MRTLHLTDLDGTLLGRDGRMAPSSAARLRRMIEEGGLLATYATARSFLSASRATAECGFRAPVAVYGGALLVDPGTGELLVRRVLDPAVVSTVIEACRRHGVPPLVYSLTEDRDTVAWVEGDESPGIAAYLAERAPDPRFRPVARHGLLPETDVFYVTVIGDEAPVGRIAAELAGCASEVSVVVQRDVYRPHETWLELTARGADKATAAIDLKERTGADRLVCFGDNLIDLAMFRIADHSVAVANAIDSVREVADEITASNDEDGVLAWLERCAGIRALRRPSRR